MPTKEEELKQLAELEELEQLEKLAAQEAKMKSAAQKEPGMLQQAKEAALQGADILGRGLDYAGGAVRGTVAGGLEALTGKELVDYKDVLAGKAPTSAEVMQKLGVPEGYSLSNIIPSMYSETGQGAALQKGGLFDPSVRGAGGLALDILTDPLTYMTGGLSTLSKFGKTGEAIKSAIKSAPVQAALTPVGTMAGKRAPKLYKKAFETVDVNLKPLNKPYSVADILSKEKFRGNMAEAADRIAEINKAVGTEQGDILKRAAEKGATVDLTKEFEPALQYAQEIKNLPTPEAAKLAQEIEDRVMYAWEKTGGSMPVDEANKLKSFINDRIKDAGFAAGEEAGLSVQAKKAIAGDLSEGVKKAVSSTDEELGKQLVAKNKMYASTSNQVQDELFKQAKTVKERREGLLGTGLTTVDLMLAGMGAQTGQWAPLAVKKAGEAAMSTKGRTSRAAFGKLLEEQKGIIDPVLRQALWVDMLKQGEQK